MVSYVVATKVAIVCAQCFSSLLVGTGINFGFRLKVRSA
jgi:hypothetical protein